MSITKFLSVSKFKYVAIGPNALYKPISIELKKMIFNDIVAIMPGVAFWYFKLASGH